jgi:A/G-specific adenine glycosylase
MLQQTQVERVLSKYESLLGQFPNFASLDRAPLQNVLQAWQGLGYNRRAVALKRIARIVDTAFDGKLPVDHKALVEMPGIGHATACAIRAFAFDKPTVFIETNIRAALIHTFFRDKQDVKDREIYPLVQCTLDQSNPRTWYYALMDYGAMLKKRFKNPNRKSAHHKKQAPFEGSNRKRRGEIVSLILAFPGTTEADIARRLCVDPEQLLRNLQKLEQEGFFRRKDDRFVIQ